MNSSPHAEHMALALHLAEKVVKPFRLIPWWAV